ncbi:unnamed protein product [Cuscuta europaea]|uniref:Uncharacterized protein n=1 Tax=Cuscuta europaea TaxID=41803 RepID=A0A9P0YXV1_CUSEU|nr:unnamed protein product [Cuscuta europaea]
MYFGVQYWHSKKEAPGGYCEETSSHLLYIIVLTTALIVLSAVVPVITFVSSHLKLSDFTGRGQVCLCLAYLVGCGLTGLGVWFSQRPCEHVSGIISVGLVFVAGILYVSADVYICNKSCAITDQIYRERRLFS